MAKKTSANKPKFGIKSLGVTTDAKTAPKAAVPTAAVAKAKFIAEKKDPRTEQCGKSCVDCRFSQDARELGIYKDVPSGAVNFAEEIRCKHRKRISDLCRIARSSEKDWALTSMDRVGVRCGPEGTLFSSDK